jgi:DnaJ like chaperone protein
MGWSGLLLGAVIGYGLTRSVWGAVVGAIIAYMVQQGRGAPAASAAGPAELRNEFFRATFEIMGHAAKADGRVTEPEIEAARQVMQDFQLSPAETAAAMAYFRSGKTPEFNPQSSTQRLLAVCGNRYDLLRHFLALQLRAALAGNGIAPPARAKLMRVAEMLGFSGLEFAYMEVSVRAQFGGGESSAPKSKPKSSLKEFYAELEVDEQVTNEEITKAYRRQMSRHHPDKLVANGLPESMAQWAKEKTQRIQEAYEGIRAARGMR